MRQIGVCGSNVIEKPDTYRLVANLFCSYPAAYGSIYPNICEPAC